MVLTRTQFFLQLPEKTIAALVKYYYSWKKTKSRTSLMDRQARKLAISRCNNLTEEGPPTSDHGSEVGSNTDSDSDDKVSFFIEFSCEFAHLREVSFLQYEIY